MALAWVQQMFSHELNPQLDMAEFEATLKEFQEDYNQKHFVRNDSFQVRHLHLHHLTALLLLGVAPVRANRRNTYPLNWTHDVGRGDGLWGYDPMRAEGGGEHPGPHAPHFYRVFGAFVHGRVLRLPAVQGAGSPPQGKHHHHHNNTHTTPTGRPKESAQGCALCEIYKEPRSSRKDYLTSTPKASTKAEHSSSHKGVLFFDVTHTHCC